MALDHMFTACTEDIRQYGIENSSHENEDTRVSHRGMYGEHNDYGGCETDDGQLQRLTYLGLIAPFHDTAVVVGSKTCYEQRGAVYGDHGRIDVDAVRPSLVRKTQKIGHSECDLKASNINEDKVNMLYPACFPFLFRPHDCATPYYAVGTINPSGFPRPRTPILLS